MGHPRILPELKAKIRELYVSGAVPNLTAGAKAYSLHPETVRAWSNKERWSDLREARRRNELAAVQLPAPPEHPGQLLARLQSTDTEAALEAQLKIARDGFARARHDPVKAAGWAKVEDLLLLRQARLQDARLQPPSDPPAGSPGSQEPPPAPARTAVQVTRADVQPTTSCGVHPRNGASCPGSSG